MRFCTSSYLVAGNQRRLKNLISTNTSTTIITKKKRGSKKDSKRGLGVDRISTKTPLSISHVTIDMTAYNFRDSNIRKTWAIFVAFLVLAIGIGWVISYIYNSPAILYIAIGISLFMNIFAYWKSDAVALSISKAYPADPSKDKEVLRIIENLSITAGIPMPRVYLIHTASMNAFATGRNPSHAAIALTTGLVDRLEKNELEGVVAHELSHIKNYDILLSTVVVVIVGFLSILSDIVIRSSFFFGRDNDKGKNPILLAVGIVALILAPIAALLMQLAISRKREFLADTSGALLTRYPEGLASALEKISGSEPFPKARNATAHLFIENPFRADRVDKKKTPFFAKLFMTHPPVEERVNALRKM